MRWYCDRVARANPLELARSAGRPQGKQSIAKDSVSLDRFFLKNAIHDFPELGFGEKVFLLERLCLHLLEHRHPFFVGCLHAELLAPLFHRWRTAVLAEDD